MSDINSLRRLAAPMHVTPNTRCPVKALHQLFLLKHLVVYIYINSSLRRHHHEEPDGLRRAHRPRYIKMGYMKAETSCITQYMIVYIG